MKRPVSALRRADGNVRRIHRYLSKRSPQGAAAWLQAFSNASERIGENPEAFAASPECVALGRDLRDAYFATRRGRTYRIVFLADSDRVYLLRVRGPGQRPLQPSQVAIPGGGEPPE